MSFHIGQAIKVRVESIGMSKAELARRLHLSAANVHKLFKRPSLDIEMLRRIGMELSYDFISHYQYLAANAITGTLVLSATGREARIIYPYHLRIKVLQALEIVQKLSGRRSREALQSFSDGHPFNPHYS